MSFSLDELSNEVRNPNDFNIFYKKPFLKINNNYVLPIPRLLWHSLSKTFHYDFLKDSDYIWKYIHEKGLAAERRMTKVMKRLFPKNSLFPRLKYSKRKGYPDIDLAIEYKEHLLFLECTAKWITRAAKTGNLEAILENLRLSILKCSNQLNRAIQAYQKGEIMSLGKNKVVLPIIVIDDPIPMIEFALNHWNILKQERPYVIDIYELDIISEISEKNEFINFVKERQELSEKNVVIATDEVDYMLLYKKRGFKEFIRLFEEAQCQLMYIAHLEEDYPNYYKDHFLEFLDDEPLANLLTSLGWLELE